MNGIYTVYKITNIKNQKIYIGITKVGLEKRWAGHVYKSVGMERKPIYIAIRKFGAKSFKIEPLCRTRTRKLALQMESALVKLYNSRVPNGYNIHWGERFSLKGYAKIKFVSHLPAFINAVACDGILQDGLGQSFGHATYAEMKKEIDKVYKVLKLKRDVKS